MKKLLTIMTLSTVLASGAAVAEVTQECVFTGRVNNTAQDGDRNQVKVTFHSAERGKNAPCRATRSGTRARVQFKADPSDRLHTLTDGSQVKYRYQRRDGKDQWELLQAKST